MIVALQEVTTLQISQLHIASMTGRISLTLSMTGVGLVRLYFDHLGTQGNFGANGINERYRPR
jgi:hypothetical protein